MLPLYSQPELETRSSLLVLSSKEEQVVNVCFQCLDSYDGGPIESRGKMYNNKKWSQAISKIKWLYLHLTSNGVSNRNHEEIKPPPKTDKKSISPVMHIKFYVIFIPRDGYVPWVLVDCLTTCKEQNILPHHTPLESTL